MFGFFIGLYRSDGASTLLPTTSTGITRTLMSNYDQLHRQCRTLENLFDAKLTSYSQLVAALSRPQDVEANGTSERWRDLEDELEDLETKVRCGYYYSRSRAADVNASCKKSMTN